MPMCLFTPPSPSQRGPLEVRVAGRTYTIEQGSPVFVEPADVVAVRAAVIAALPSSTLTTPGGIQ
jgi:hypothetical protein